MSFRAFFRFHQHKSKFYPLGQSLPNNHMFIRYGCRHIQIQSESEQSTELNLPLPVLGKQHVEKVPLQSSRYRKEGPFHLWEDGNLLFGFTRAQLTTTDSKVSQELYQELFKITKGTFLYRAWNYLPQLNSGEGDSECYKQFCEGRSSAFHKVFGENEFTYMPAGTCVGIGGNEVVVCFLAGSQSPDHHENPNQVPAYRYPRQYGPKSPSFARATSVHLNNRHCRFISGTAAVLGHESQGGSDLQRQLEITCDNLELVAKQTLNGQGERKDTGSKGNGKVYLRRSTDFEEARSYLEKRFPEIADSIIYLRSDICRKELLVEIELSFIDS